MSLLPQQVTASPGRYFTAIQNAVSGGGGGGSVSSIVNGGSSVVCDPSGVLLGASAYIAGSAGYVNWNNVICLPAGGISTTYLEVSSINNAAYPPSQSDVFSTIQVSSINGLQYPPAQSDNFSTLFTSTLGGAGGQPLSLESDLIVNPNYQVLGGGSNAGTGASLNNFQTISCGNLDTTVINAAYSASNIQINAPISVAGAVSCSNVVADAVSTTNILASNVYASTISRLGNPQDGWPAPGTPGQGLLPLGIPRTADAGSYTNMIQGGFVNNFPYLSTVLFQYPYQADNTPICVQLTATTNQVTGGANPNISLNSGWGYFGTGVSSIGFSVDARNGGVGYNASFYWLAYPATQ